MTGTFPEELAPEEEELALEGIVGKETQRA